VTLNGVTDGLSAVWVVSPDTGQEGFVSLGGDFVITATGTKLDASTQVMVYDGDPNAGGQLIEDMEIHTSCSAPLVVGDQFLSFQLVGLVGENGDVVVLPPPGDELGEQADDPTGPLAAVGTTVTWNYVVTNDGETVLANVGVSDDQGVTPVFVKVLTETGDPALFEPGDQWLFSTSGLAQLGQYANIGTTVGTPADDAGTPLPGAGDVTDADPSHYLGIFPPGDQCDNGKAARLTMLYTGNNVISHSQDAGKVVVDPESIAAPGSAFIVATDKSDPNDSKARIYFSGTVALGDSFLIDALNAGQSKLTSRTHVFIYDSEGGNLLQSIEFHTSCSQPLELGDQYGNIQLVGFVAEGDVSGGGDGVVLDSLDFKGKELKLKLANNGSSTVTITDLAIAFPEATNGLLLEIKQRKATLYKPDGGAPSPVIIGPGDWLGNEDDRQIDPGKVIEYKFKFQNDVLKNFSQYSIIFAFDDGTTLNLPS